MTWQRWALFVAGAALVMAGCSTRGPAAPTGSAAISSTIAGQGEGPVSSLSAPPTEQLTALGGLNLNGYCQSTVYAGATLTKPQLGPNAAFNNWRCVTSSGDTHPFSMEQACKWQYSLEAVQAHPRNADDAYTWVCYATPAGK
jgi:hypothetical protein